MEVFYPVSVFKHPLTDYNEEIKYIKAERKINIKYLLKMFIKSCLVLQH